MKQRSILLLFFFIFSSFCALRAQDLIVVDGSRGELGKTIANRFSIYEVTDNAMSPETFLDKKATLTARKITRPLENLDFTTSSFFIHFSVKNTTAQKVSLILETARPITNEVVLYDVGKQTYERSGDELPFDQKTIRSNYSALPLVVEANSTSTYVLKISSDGESVQLPMIFYQAEAFYERSRSSQLLFGIFIGFFIFTILIYTSFYALLKEILFLKYVLYVFFTGFLQFSLEGYLHQFIFKSGGYFTQHSIILVAGMAVLLALNYGASYLRLKGKKLRIARGISIGVGAVMLISLVDGPLYELAFPLINLLSFIGMVFVLSVAIVLRKKQEVDQLFIIGLSCLVSGGLIFVLGNVGVINYPKLTQPALNVGTLLEIICLSILMVYQYKRLQADKEEAQQQLVVQLEQTNELLELEVAERTKELNEQRLLLKQRNEDFVASVTYAQRIQQAVLSDETKLRDFLPESFVFFRPKDIVSGDFFWVDKVPPTDRWPSGLIIYATVDCTGHGVPGAFVSIIGNHLLELCKINVDVQNPGEALDFLNREINKSLNSKYGFEKLRDGMDLSFCALDLHAMKLYFAGAKNAAYVVRKGELIELKGDRKPIGFDEHEGASRFTTIELALEKGDMIYTFSDGYADQFGGPSSKKFMVKRLKALLIEQSQEKLPIQMARIELEFDRWKGNHEQIDDVLLIGVKV